MFKKFGFSKELSQEEELAKFLADARKIYAKAIEKELSSLSLDKTVYSVDSAVVELGLDKELIETLVEDFVTQIIKYIPIFMMHIENLKKNQEELDYTILRNLAHKNLGVARNLRISNAQKILNELMTKDSLSYLEKCVRILEAYVIILKPDIALKTLEHMEIKAS